MGAKSLLSRPPEVVIHTIAKSSGLKLRTTEWSAANATPTIEST